MIHWRQSRLFWIKSMSVVKMITNANDTSSLRVFRNFWQILKYIWHVRDYNDWLENWLNVNSRALSTCISEQTYNVYATPLPIQAGKSAAMYVCFALYVDFSIWYWNCSDSVAYLFLFHYTSRITYIIKMYIREKK